MADKNAIEHFERSLPMQLLRARETVMKSFLPTLKEFDLTPQQWRVIRVLEKEDGLDLSEVANRCYLLMPSLSRIVPRLEQRQIVRREVSPTDQRRSVLFLTAEGKRLFAQIMPKSIARYNHIAERFGPGKLALLFELLDELNEKL